MNCKIISHLKKGLKRQQLETQNNWRNSKFHHAPKNSLVEEGLVQFHSFLAFRDLELENILMILTAVEHLWQLKQERVMIRSLNILKRPFITLYPSKSIRGNRQTSERCTRFLIHILDSETSPERLQCKSN